MRSNIRAQQELYSEGVINARVDTGCVAYIYLCDYDRGLESLELVDIEVVETVALREGL